MRKLLSILGFLLIVLSVQLITPEKYHDVSYTWLALHVIHPVQTFLGIKNKCLSSCFINASLLEQKLKAGLPLWAAQQINNDLQSFSTLTSTALDNYFTQNTNAHNQLVHIKIRNKKIKLIKSPIIKYPGALEIIIDVIQYLAKNNLIPDTDFILGLEDYLIANTIVNQSIPLFTFAKDIARPIEKNFILVPDWMNIIQAFINREFAEKNTTYYAWHEKKPILFWRGGMLDSTGFRSKLVNYASQVPHRIDAKFAVAPNHNSNTNNITSNYVPLPAQLAYRYFISIDGKRCTWDRLVWQLQSNSLVFKPESSQIQWFYGGIKAERHYLSIKSLNDILPTIDWAELHPTEVQTIIQNANRFARENLQLEDFYLYYLVLLQAYSKKLILNS